MLGASFLLGGLRHHLQEYNRINATHQAGLLFLATVALLIPSAISHVDSTSQAEFTSKLSVGLSVLLITAYGLGLLFSLKTHRELFASRNSGRLTRPRGPWHRPDNACNRHCSRRNDERDFCRVVQEAAEVLGLTPAFVGFIVVALVGAAAEMTAAFSASRKDRLDLVSASLWGSSADRTFRGAGADAVELRHRPIADGPPVLARRHHHGTNCHHDRVTRDDQRAFSLVYWRAGADGLPDFRSYALFASPLPIERLWQASKTSMSAHLSKIATPRRTVVS